MPAIRVSASLGIGRDTERRVLLGQAGRRQSHLVLVGLRLRLDGDLDDRLGEGHRLEDLLVLGIGEGVTGHGVLQADHRRDVSRVDLLDLLAVVGVHLEEPSDPLPPDALLGIDRGHVQPALSVPE